MLCSGLSQPPSEEGNNRQTGVLRRRRISSKNTWLSPPSAAPFIRLSSSRAKYASCTCTLCPRYAVLPQHLQRAPVYALGDTEGSVVAAGDLGGSDSPPLRGTLVYYPGADDEERWQVSPLSTEDGEIPAGKAACSFYITFFPSGVYPSS